MLAIMPWQGGKSRETGFYYLRAVEPGSEITNRVDNKPGSDGGSVARGWRYCHKSGEHGRKLPRKEMVHIFSLKQVQPFHLLKRGEKVGMHQKPNFDVARISG
jgi:hypothetical protein